MTTQYSTNVVEGMQALYGKGFLSPGGAEEMAVLLEGVDLSGRTVLDIGCGSWRCGRHAGRLLRAPVT